MFFLKCYSLSVSFSSHFLFLSFRSLPFLSFPFPLFPLLSFPILYFLSFLSFLYVSFRSFPFVFYVFFTVCSVGDLSKSTSTQNHKSTNDCTLSFGRLSSSGPARKSCRRQLDPRRAGRPPSVLGLGRTAPFSAPHPFFACTLSSDCFLSGWFPSFWWVPRPKAKLYAANMVVKK